MDVCLVISVNTVIIGVGTFIGPRTLKSLYSIEKIQLMIMVATFNDNSSTTIVSFYSPTYASDETDLDASYNIIPKYNVLIIGRDLNAQIGSTTRQTEMGWLVVWVLCHINLCRLFITKCIFIPIISSISDKSV